jgi:hypothetical protein
MGYHDLSWLQQVLYVFTELHRRLWLWILARR